MSNSDLAEFLEEWASLLDRRPQGITSVPDHTINMLRQSAAALRSAGSAREAALKEALALRKYKISTMTTIEDCILVDDIRALLPAQPKAEPVKPEGGGDAEGIAGEGGWIYGRY